MTASPDTTPSPAAMAALRRELAASHALPENDKRVIAMAERTAKLWQTRRELAEQYKLPVDDPRIQQAALAATNQKNWESKILLGQAVPNDELEAYSKIISQLLGKPKEDLVVRFVDADLSEGERSELRALREAAARKPVSPTVDSPAAPVTVSEASEATPDSNKALPANVTPIRPKPEPKRSDTDFAVARDHDGKPRGNGFAGMSAAEVAAEINVPSGSGNGPPRPTQKSAL